MVSSAEEPTFKTEIDGWLRMIDAEFTETEIELSQRPLLAAIKFVDLAVMQVHASSEGPVEPPKGAAMVNEPWFRAVFRHTQVWYEKRYGVRVTPPERTIKAMVPVMGIATLLKVPGTISKPDVPGETIWISFPSVVLDDEDPMSWLVDAPNLETDEPAEAKRARKLVYEVAGAIRAINCRLTGIPHDDPEKIELLAGVLPGLQRAAELLVQADEQALKSAHWEIQMAIERVLKALTYERSSTYDQIHDLFTLYDRVPAPPLSISRDQLKKLPDWQTMAELRYGRGPARSAEQGFTVYRTALKIVVAATRGFPGIDLSQAQLNVRRPPWTRPLEEVFHLGKGPKL